MINIEAKVTQSIKIQSLNVICSPRWSKPNKITMPSKIRAIATLTATEISDKDILLNKLPPATKNPMRIQKNKVFRSIFEGRNFLLFLNIKNQEAINTVDSSTMVKLTGPKKSMGIR